MYHRFNENKYPSTNIRNEIFLEHLDEINNSKFEFITFDKFNAIIKSKIEKNYLLGSGIISKRIINKIECFLKK